MDLLDRYLEYEAWTLRHFIERCREVRPEARLQLFDMGHGTLHETLEHIIRNLEIWTDLLRGRSVRSFPALTNTVDDYLPRFDAAMADFADCARTLAGEDRLGATYVDTLDNSPTAKEYGATILHVLTHTTVHRWEIQHMLQRLGVGELLEGDALGWHMRRGSGNL